MDVIQIILRQQLVVIGLGLAAALLGLALLLSVVAQIVRLIRRLRRPKASDALETGEESVMDNDDTLFPSGMASASAAGTVSPAGQPDTTAAVLLSSSTSAATATSETKEEGMQSLLSSVFTNEEAFERYDKLLKGLDKVDVLDLAALSRKVADSLRKGAA